jgi:hypothetical protein
MINMCLPGDERNQRRPLRTQCFLARVGQLPALIRTGLLEQAKSASVSAVRDKVESYSSWSIGVSSELLYPLSMVHQLKVNRSEVPNRVWWSLLIGALGIVREVRDCLKGILAVSGLTSS